MIFGPGWAMLLSVEHLYFWVELPIQRTLCSIFVKLWVQVKGTQ